MIATGCASPRSEGGDPGRCSSESFASIARAFTLGWRIQPLRRILRRRYDGPPAPQHCSGRVRKMSFPDPVAPYSRHELLAAQDGRWPERGVPCERCGVLVPQFADLQDVDRARILKLVTSGQMTLAQEEVKACTGAPERFAKIWVIHAGWPRPRSPGPPCPHCGMPLATSRAKQCLHCHRDWH